MYSRFRRVMSFVGLTWIFAGAAFVSIGCGSLSLFGPFNPFLAARFNATLAGVVSGGNLTSPANPGAGNPAGGVVVISSLTELPISQRTLQVSVQNESEQRVRFSMTFVVSAGAGGFVPDSEIQDYLNAGYSDAAPPGGGGSATIGCDTITLARGTRLLTMAFGINQGSVATLAGNAGGLGGGAGVPTFVLARRDTGSVDIPLPELIVFGSSDPDFICSGGAVVGNLCTQRGFVYTSVADLPVGKPVEAFRIQGTVCETNFGTAPEWRLDLTLDSQVQPFQYGRGGTIVARVLDRSADDPTETRNQAVWTVTDSNNTTLHFPDQ